MASGTDGANGRAYAAWLAQGQLFGFAIQLQVDPLVALEREGVLLEELCERLRQGYLSLLLAFYFETPLKRDLDGGLKITQDALCEGLGLNDNRVVSIHLLKYIDPLHPHLYIELEALDDWRFDEEYVVLGQ